MRVPEALKPWRPWLDWFDAEIVDLLGELLLRLHPMLGAFRMRAQRGVAEPEGIDDLRRRGHYERLLLSEWALADEVPEEFDRRAAGGEHLFLSPKLVAREADALTVAVFDTGPSQLGAPRLVHVAMWILLAERAQAAKARFAWGVLGAPGALHPADSPERLKQLLQARSLAPGGAAAASEGNAQVARDEHEREWRRLLDEADPSPGERWSIGAHAAGYGLGHRVDVSRAAEQQLAVTIASRQARRELRLTLPSPERSSALLRGEFERVAVARLSGVQTGAHGGGKLSLKQPPLIAWGARHIAVPLAGENAAHVYRLPSSEATGLQPPKTTRWGKGKSLLAATLTERHFAGVIPQAQWLEGWQLEGMGRLPLPPPGDLDVTTGKARLQPCVWFNRGAFYRRLLLLSSQRKLLSWTRHASESTTYEIVAEQVLAIARADAERMVYLRQDEGHLHLHATHRSQVLERVAFLGPVNAAFLSGTCFADRWRGGYCVEQIVGGHGGERSSIWRVFARIADRPPSEYEIVLPGDWKVVGLSQPDGDDIGLIALRPDRKALLRIGAQERSVLYESPSPISTVSVAVDADLIALVDLQGRLVVLRDGARKMLVYTGGDDG
ncbi:hypothetical protein [Lysobacter antibioticus]|uniref:Uncharacterized protein n=1 Tax=Lysobacter antibioticus TaxID=84531 RepID=A0A0S2F8Z2_LYSAN|nr:hypothetical protein [Lysobacter antibioticus]ALN79979.1 hypothetical protein LA76x_1827 [Lysobacter antibioticus]